jgi:hypothetical protein
VLKDCAGEPELILIATGSEVGLAVQAFDKLTEQGRKVRVVSMPCTSVFDAQDAGYKQSVLPLQVSARIAIEAAHADFWYKYVGLEGRVIGMTTYGESAPASACSKSSASPWTTSWVRLKSCWKTETSRRVAFRAPGCDLSQQVRSQPCSSNGDTIENPMPQPRPYKVALNGYGRIGRCVLRALFERGEKAGFEIVAINDLADMASIEYLTRFDSTHGRFPAR